MAAVVSLREPNCGRQLIDALINDAYALVKEHGVDLAAASEYQDRISGFFRQSREAKDVYRRPVIGGLRGYVGIGEEVRPQRPDGPYDLRETKECYHSGRKDNRHPPEYELDELSNRLFDQLEHVLERSLACIGTVIPAIGRLHDGIFPIQQKWRGAHLLRMIEYKPDVSALRLGPHRDLSLLTIMPCPSAKGLEFQKSDGSWELAPLDQDALIVTCGYLLASICASDGVNLPAGVHQVVSVDDIVQRRSLTFFGMIPLEYEIPVWYERKLGQQTANGAEIMYERLQRSYTSLEAQPFDTWLSEMREAN
ncbi:MAG: 2OG-Fe(II) oxygenase family protein [Candidatus Sulfotelmatobacter sp.]